MSAKNRAGLIRKLRELGYYHHRMGVAAGRDEAGASSGKIICDVYIFGRLAPGVWLPIDYEKFTADYCRRVLINAKHDLVEHVTNVMKGGGGDGERG